jgi:hypothetical protein
MCERLRTTSDATAPVRRALRRKALLREAARWRRVETARAYVSAVERAAAERSGVSDLARATAAWTKWARAVLDELDLTTPRAAARDMIAACMVDPISRGRAPADWDSATANATMPRSASTMTSP